MCFQEGAVMLKNNRNIFRIALLFLLSFVAFLFTATSTIAAPTVSQVYNAAPDGLNISDYMTGVEKYNDGTINNVKIYKSGSSYGNKSDIIQLMTDQSGASSKQLSSIWGKRPDDPGSTDDKIDNYFDLSKKQTVSAWIYLGDKDGYPSGTANNDTAKSLPDGLAFVLQDDARGSRAIATTNSGESAFGETLGVWGSSGQSGNNSTISRNLGLTAIQNSFALEFDTLQNNTPITSILGKDDFFDGGYYNGSQMAKGQHIAWNYPASTEIWSGDTLTPSPNNNVDVPYTYMSNYYSLGLISPYYYGLVHRDSLQNIDLTGQYTVADSWQHFRLTYTPPASGSTVATISYVFNDKTYDGKIKPYTQYNKKNNRQIDIARFMKNGNTKVRWGFTASTGSPNSAPSTFAAIMQEMPNTANIDTTTKLYDLSQYDSNGNLGREISDLDKKETLEAIDPATKNPEYNVANGDNLRFDYNLTYNSGFAGTGGEITTAISLPKSVDFTPDADNNIGQIVYSGFSDDSKNKTVKISASDIENDVLNLNLQTMDTEGQIAKIELFGKANATTTPTKVLGQHVSYKSLHFIDDVMSPSFLINDRLNLSTKDNLDLGSIDIKSTDNNQVDLNLTTNYAGGSSFDTKGVTLYTQIDDKTPTTSNISTSDGKSSYDIANNIANSTQFSASYLGVGDHKIKVYVIDSLKRVSDPIVYTVNVKGKELKLLVDDIYSFQNINYKSSTGFVKRNGDWKVSVLSADTPWTLTASAADLTLEGDKSQTIGPLFYRDKNNNDFSMANQTPVIASDDNTSAATKTTDVSGNWGNEDGILLQNNTVKPAGKYSGVIKWNLIDSVS